MSATATRAAVGRQRHPSEETTSLWWWIRSIFSWVIVLIVLGLLTVMIIIPRAVGATPYTVLTGSMKPHYPPGSLIIVRPTDPQDLTVGQVITYQLESGQPGVVTHRIISVGYTVGGERTFVTQGDANDAPDEKTVRAVQVRGALWYAVPYVGYLNSWISGRARTVVVGLIVIGLLIYAAIMFIGAGQDHLQTRRKSLARRPSTKPRLGTEKQSETEAESAIVKEKP